MGGAGIRMEKLIKFDMADRRTDRLTGEQEASRACHAWPAKNHIL